MTTYTIRAWHGRSKKYAGGSRTMKFKTDMEPDEFWEQLAEFMDGIGGEPE